MAEKTVKKNASKEKEDKTSMNDKQASIKEMQERRQRDRRIIDEIWSVTILAVGAFLIITTQLNTTGAFGDAIHDFLLGLFGFMAYVLPYYFIVLAFCLLFKKMQHINARTAFFSFLIFIMLCILNSYRFLDVADFGYSFGDLISFYRYGVDGEYGGAIGMELAVILVKLLGKPGLIILSLAVIAISLLLVVNTPISNSIARMRDRREEKSLMKDMEAAEAEKVSQAVANAGAGMSVSPEDFLQSGQKRPVELEEESESAIRILSPIKSAAKRSKQAIAPEKSLSKDSTLVQTRPQELDYLSYSIDTDLEQRNKDNIMRLMSETQIGDESYEATSAGYGLDGESRSAGSGYGLDGYWGDEASTASDSSGVSFGLDGIREESSPVVDSPISFEEEPTQIPVSAMNTTIDIFDEPKSSVTSHLDDKADLAAAASALNTKEVKKANTPTAQDQEELRQEIESGAASTKTIHYTLPSVELLKKPKSTQMKMSENQLGQRAELLERTLRNFHVDAKVINVTQGSSVTRYEVQPAIGVKVSSITKLADDIALNMRAKSIRIEAPIPGKAAVGIEVENEKAATVFARELIDSDEFRNAKSKISFVVGKDISGKNIIANLKEMPHLLIAGATGSGKSVCINTIITSILYKARPDEVKMILIDPKVVELGNYNGIPHMLIPVVTDPKKAAAALSWAVKEMTDRYKAFADEGVKDLDSYNELMLANQEGEKVMPQVVIIIDELADLMMAAPSQVEESICRLAQMARAAGMHLIVATQRPSVDIVTGVIKANIPSRIAFSVSSQFDSRTILDVGGAEKLLGKGDMLYSPVGSNKPIRVQGPYISDTEISKVIQAVKKQSTAEYDETVKQAIEAPGKAEIGQAGDELTEDAIAFILKSQKASVSMLQRRFRIGYNRAASIIDEIEERGIISPADGSRPRQVLYKEEEYYSGLDQSAEGETDTINE